MSLLISDSLYRSIKINSLVYLHNSALKTISKFLGNQDAHDIASNIINKGLSKQDSEVVRVKLRMVTKEN